MTTKEQLTQLKQITNQQSTEIADLRKDVKAILAVTNEFRGGQKLMKWVVGTTIAIGGLATAITALIKGS